MRVFIVGMPGSGKSTLVKKLANRLNSNPVDLDALIELNQMQLISSIFSEKGEDFFRKIENKTLLEALKEDNFVMACGGGTPCFFNNMDSMLQNGVVVYLQMPVKAILTRVKDSDKRPLLNRFKTDLDKQNYLTELLNQREGDYSRAHLIVSGIGLNAEKINQLVKKIEGVAGLV